MKLTKHAKFAIEQANKYPGSHLAKLPEWYEDSRKQFEDYLEKNQPLNYPLLTLQKRSVAHAIASKYTAIFDQMGAGKTAQALAISVLGGHRHTCIICPNALKDNWLMEIQKFTGTPMSQVFIGRGRDLSAIPSSLVSNFKFFIFNYEAGPVVCKTPEIFPAVLKQCSHIVFDEIHNMKNALTKVYQSWYYLLYNARPNQLTMLSGTPFDRYAGELYSYFQILDLNPSIPGDLFTTEFPNICHWEQRFAVPRNNDSYHSYKPSELPVIRNIFGRRPVRRDITDITELPPLTNQNVDLPDHLFKTSDMEELESKFKWALRMMFLRESKKISEEESCTLGTIQNIRVEISHAKVPYTIQMAEKYIQAFGPVVVFFEFTKPLKEFQERLKKKGYAVEIVHGEMNDNDRNITVDQFKNSQLHVLAATFGTLAEGVNLQISNAVIFNDIPWRPLLISQAERRVWRIGQTRHCFQISMLCSVDNIILNNILSKNDYINDLYGILDHIRTKEKF